jgi:hypothetical protein
MIVDRCDRSSSYKQSLTESTKNPTGVKGILDISVPGHFGTDLDISVLSTGQFGTWMRQYSVYS